MSSILSSTVEILNTNDRERERERYYSYDLPSVPLCSFDSVKTPLDTSSSVYCTFLTQIFFFAFAASTSLLCSSRFPPSAWKGSTLCTPSCNVPEEEAESIQLTRSCRCRRRGDSHTELLLWKFSLEISQSGLQKSSAIRKKQEEKKAREIYSSDRKKKKREEGRIF